MTLRSAEELIQISMPDININKARVSLLKSKRLFNINQTGENKPSNMLYHLDMPISYVEFKVFICHLAQELHKSKEI